MYNSILILRARGKREAAAGVELYLKALAPKREKFKQRIFRNHIAIYLNARNKMWRTTLEHTIDQLRATGLMLLGAIVSESQA